MTRERLFSYLKSAADAHMNTLRIWGGGVSIHIVIMSREICSEVHWFWYHEAPLNNGEKLSENPFHACCTVIIAAYKGEMQFPHVAIGHTDIRGGRGDLIVEPRTPEREVGG